MSDFETSSWADKAFAENYLDRADIYIPERRRMFGVVSSLFKHFHSGNESVKLLDLGCGDGVFTEALFKVRGDISATLVDGNEAMLRRAEERLKSYREVKYLKASFGDILNGSANLEYYDVCVSSQAIHHLEMDEKASLFRLVSSHLKPGGHFVDIDVVLPPSADLEAWYFSTWKNWMAEMMERHGVTDETPEDLIRRYKDPASANRPDTLERQLSVLKGAGFTEVDCYFKNGIFAVFGGRKGI